MQGEDPFPPTHKIAKSFKKFGKAYWVPTKNKYLLPPSLSFTFCYRGIIEFILSKSVNP